MRHLLVLGPVIFLSLLAASCGDKGVPPTPEPITSLRIISGNNQIPKAGAFLPDSFLVRVVTSTGIPMADVEVAFEQITAINGGYFVWNTIRLTNDSGYAKNKYYADEIIGLDSIRVTASGVNDSVKYFTLNVVPDDPDTIYIVSGDDQGNYGGQKLPEPCVVKVTDRFGNPVSDFPVWFKTSDRCLVETDSSANQPFLTDSAFTCTDENGEASAEWIMTVNPTPLLGTWPNINPTMSAYGAVVGATRLFNGTAYNPGAFRYYYSARNVFEDNCFICHAGDIRQGSYVLDYFYEVAGGGNLDPPDSSAPLLYYMKPENHSFVHNANLIEQDIIINWVAAHDTAHGSSGLNNYTNNMKNIFDLNCATGGCHDGAATYDMTSFPGLRAGGLDATPNAIRGDSASLLAQVLLPGGSMREYFGVDSVALSDSVINWIVDDSLRQY